MYEQYCAIGKQCRNIFMPLLLGFPLKMTADIKAFGTNDEDLGGDLFF